MYFLISITVTYRGGSRQRVSGSGPNKFKGGLLAEEVLETSNITTFLLFLVLELSLITSSCI